MLRRATLLLLTLLAACSRGGSTDATRPLEMLVPTDAETLDPRYATDAVALRTTRLLHAGLVRLDPNTLSPQPYLARSWQWEDERTLRVELREARFHSGAPFGARDVAATIAAFQSPKVGSRHARVVEPIGSVDVVDEHTVRITLKHAHATLLTDLEIPILRADEAASPPRGDGSLDGLGPFAVERRDEGAIVLKPAKDGALPTPAHGVTIRTVHDENARALRMHAGRADLVVNGFSPTLLPSLSGAKGISVVTRPGANLTYLLMRVDQGLLSDRRFRRAVADSVDKKRIADTLFAGHATPARTLLPTTHWAHSELTGAPDSYSLKYTQEDVARLLKTLDARSFSLTLLTSTDRLRGTIARQMAQDFGNAGIELEVVPIELGTMLARLAAGDFELAMLQLPELTEPNVLRFFLHSENIPPVGANRGRVRDGNIDALLDRGAAVSSEEKRREIYAELEERMRYEAYLVPLWHEEQIAVTSQRASSFRPSAEGRWLDLALVP